MPLAHPKRHLAIAAAASLMLAAAPVFAAAAAIAPGDGSASSAPKPPSVTVVSAAAGEIVSTAVVTGSLRPKEEILVNAELDGLAIVEILAEEGDRVAEGQVLARLSRDTADVTFAQADARVARASAAISQARTQIVQAEASLRQAQNAFARADRLRKTGTASEETFENREIEAQVAEAKVNEAKQTLMLAEADRALAEAQKREQMWRLGRTEIKAPASGVVSRRVARLGAVVAGSGDPLFRIIADGAIELEADVAEATLGRLAVGQKAQVTPAGREHPVAGTIRLISPEIDAATRLGQVRIALETVPGLAIGAFAYGVIETARETGVLVPLSAVLYDARSAQVLVVEDGVAHARDVEVGLVAHGTAEIVEGVAAGEKVVAISGTFLRDGDRVNPVVAVERHGLSGAMGVSAFSTEAPPFAKSPDGLAPVLGVQEPHM